MADTREKRRSVEYYLYAIVEALLDAGREPTEVREGVEAFAKSFGFFPLPPEAEE